MKVGDSTIWGPAEEVDEEVGGKNNILSEIINHVLITVHTPSVPLSVCLCVCVCVRQMTWLFGLGTRLETTRF